MYISAIIFLMRHCADDGVSLFPSCLEVYTIHE